MIEFEETTKETEADADTEILQVRHTFEKKLKDEKEIVMKLKGENGIMKKRFSTISSEIESHKTEISKLFNEEKKLYSIIKNLEKDIVGLKREVNVKEWMIGSRKR